MSDLKLISQKNQDPATDYAVRVVRGLEPAGPLVFGSCKRHLAELEVQGTVKFPYVWRPEHLEYFNEFCLLLEQYKGEWKGQPLRMMLWQSFIVGNLLSWVSMRDGLRRFRTCYAEVPRKNGKSALASAFCLYMLMMDGESGAEVYTAATKLEQAKIVYGDALKFLPYKLRAKYIRSTVHGSFFDSTQSTFTPLASNSKRMDGLNPHCAVADEIHEWPDRGLWDVIEDGMGSRRQPIMFGITTAGHNKYGIAMNLRNTGEMLANDKGERKTVLDQFFSYIACPSDADKRLWWEPRVWAACNPCLGQAKRIQYMEEQAASARVNPQKLNTFLNKQLNVWTDAASRWISSEDWENCATKDLDELRSSVVGEICYGALDIGKVSDLTSFVLYWPPTSAEGVASKHRFIAWHWCPEEKARNRSRRDKVPYVEWSEDGHIRLTSGNVSDFQQIGADVAQLCSRFSVDAVAYDAMFAGETVQRLQEEGIHMLEHRQGFLSMSPPAQEFERLIMGRMMMHEGSPILNWQAGNVVVSTDPAGNIKPDKKNSAEKIDGIVSCIMAIGCKMFRCPGEEEFSGEVGAAL